jgi:acyl-CoA synthetase (AMP-forming)/AMP-acid ligase II
MQIREHLGADKPAIILHPSGVVVTFDELEARANRLAHYFRCAGLVEGDAVAILMENQHPPDRAGSRLHRRQQRRQSDYRFGCAAQDLRKPRRTPPRRPTRGVADRR